MKIYRLLKWHTIQIFRTFKTRKNRGDMPLDIYHCYRIAKLWEYRYADINYTKTI